MLHIYIIDTFVKPLKIAKNNILNTQGIDDNTREELNIDEQIKYIESQLTNYEK